RRRPTRRRQRRRTEVPTVALAGYTNAGKSTLLNALTGADVSVENRLFETLDPTTRAFEHDGRRYLVTDTVGFIRRLPHQLVEGFAATLEETLEADLVLHVGDASASDAELEETTSAVTAVLREIGADALVPGRCWPRSDLLRACGNSAWWTRGRRYRACGRDSGGPRRSRRAALGARRASRDRQGQLPRSRRRGVPRRGPRRPLEHGSRGDVRRRAGNEDRAARHRPGPGARDRRSGGAPAGRARRPRLRLFGGVVVAVEPRIRVSALLRWRDRLLLCRHEKPGKEYWLLPGGGVKSGESLVDALHRELEEELGVGDDVLLEGPVAIADSIAPVRSFAPKHVVHIIFAGDL